MNDLKIGFGGGCHWCTEGVFQMIKGVSHVDQGWIASSEENSTFSEAVIVTYNPKIISLNTLIEIHINTHASTSSHSLRKKYRSAIYSYSEKERDNINLLLQKFNSKQNLPIITQSLLLKRFKRNKETYLNYFRNNPSAPFCTRYILPKINGLTKSHPTLIVKG